MHPLVCKFRDSSGAFPDASAESSRYRELHVAITRLLTLLNLFNIIGSALPSTISARHSVVLE